MGVNRHQDRRGKERLFVRKRWPDGEQFYRTVPNVTEGKRLLARIEAVLANGEEEWRSLREQLKKKGAESPWTIARLADRYLENCRVKNRRPDFKETVLKGITQSLGEIPLKQFRRGDAWQYIEVRRKEGVANATINRGIAVLKNMFSYALEMGLVESHPLTRFSLLPEPQNPMRILTLEEERALVTAAFSVDPHVGAYVALLGETAMRKSEGLRLEWSHLDFAKRLVTVAESKSNRPRTVPLTGFALEALAQVNRVVGVSRVFTKPDRSPWKDPRESFDQARKAAGLSWVGLHDLRTKGQFRVGSADRQR